MVCDRAESSYSVTMLMNSTKADLSYFVTALLNNTKTDPSYSVTTLLINTKADLSYSATALLNIGIKLSEKFIGNWTAKEKVLKTHIDICKTTTKEAVQIANALDTNKGSGLQHISSDLIRDVFVGVPDINCHLFSQSFEQGKFIES